MTDLVQNSAEASGGDSGTGLYRVKSTSLYASGILSAGTSTESYHVKWPNIPPTWQVTLATN